MKIGGVGHGTQTCDYALKATLAIEHTGDGAAHLHEWTAPIVEKEGERLPGLLGMDSLEASMFTLGREGRDKRKTRGGWAGDGVVRCCCCNVLQ